MLALLSIDEIEIDLTTLERRILEDFEEAEKHTKSFDHFETRHLRRLLNAGYITTPGVAPGYAITPAGRVALVKARRRWPSTHPLTGL